METDKAENIPDPICLILEIRHAIREWFDWWAENL